MWPFILSFVLWAVIHSVTAAHGTKQWMRRIMGQAAYEGLYRLLYNIFAGVSLLPVLVVLATQVPSDPLWSIPRPYRYVANLMQLVGLIGLLISLWQTDVWAFVGLRQAVAYLVGNQRPKGVSRLVTGGAYALVRHPLYFFSLLVIWFNPDVTLDVLLFSVLSTLYFWMGSKYEDRRLESEFGQPYRDYRDSVPSLLPLRLTRNTSS